MAYMQSCVCIARLQSIDREGGKSAERSPPATHSESAHRTHDLRSGTETVAIVGKRGSFNDSNRFYTCKERLNARTSGSDKRHGCL